MLPLSASVRDRERDFIYIPSRQSFLRALDRFMQLRPEQFARRQLSKVFRYVNPVLAQP